ncbi:MAG: hydroxypyruvate isomerase [Vitreoscilla sp.]|nr:hydroxypyruvate isomerase [Burkholderiales bacterium]MBP6338346.1 hydroxypyruvate isomerase [Vitreoscilla sp.]
MPRFTANLSLLFADVPFLDRFERAARAGFEFVEFQFPYAWPAGEIRARLDAHGLRAVLHNLPAGDWAAGDRGLGCHPARVDEFRAGIPLAIGYARALGVQQLNLLAGKAPAGASEADLRQTFVANVRHAAAALATEGLYLLIEPINSFDIPGFWLNRSDQAINLLDEAGTANACLQYDIYHLQRMEGEVAGTLQRLLPRIGHIQFADNPGRHEPGTGELNFDFLFAHLDAIGYAGFVGAEYLPMGRTEDGLGWWQRWGPGPAD